MNAEMCKVCLVSEDQRPEDEPNHNSTPKHKFNWMLWIYNNYRKALVKNRDGVEVKVEVVGMNGLIYNYTNDLKKGKHTLEITPEGLQLHQNHIKFKCTVKNVRRDKSLILVCAQLLHNYSWFQFQDQGCLSKGNPVELAPEAEYEVIVEYHSDQNMVGSYKIPVMFVLQTKDAEPKSIYFCRSINVSIGEHHESKVEETGPSPFKGNPWPPSMDILPPVPNKGFPDLYSMPLHYLKFLTHGVDGYCDWRGGGGENHLLQELRNHLAPGHVTPNNYKMFWRVVLWFEELAQAIMLQQYNMENVKLVRDGDVFELEVPGLAEKRPSVIAGDFIDLKTVGDDHRGYRGVVVKVQDKSLLIGNVDNEFVNYHKNVNPDIEMSVRFVLGRLSYERMHQGVTEVVNNGVVQNLFPEDSLRRRNVPQRKTPNDSDFKNRAILNNLEQKTAVLKMLKNTSSPAPYILFGPPGTGKTVTLVEAIVQIKNKTGKKILVCAPANAACNVIAEKLMMYCKKNEMIRVMAQNVDISNTNPALFSYSNYDRVNETFKKVYPEELVNYRIVISTLIYAGQFTRKFHPDVIIIDEAAQALEPEACSALGLAEKQTQIILAGDPMQLGPSVFSTHAKKYQLDISLLERLTELDLYKSGDTNYITMLKKNFRSHEMILKLPNELFYNGQLEALSVDAREDPLATVSVFHNIPSIQGKKGRKRHPGAAIEYFSVISKERRQGKSPSYFNDKEIQMVCACVKALLQLEFPDRDRNVKQEEIGVVTPYVRQVHKVREHLKGKGFEHVEVGTTETFQGREKRIIIISTVRAQKDLLLYDKKYRLGFVRQRKRFNVALTRAKAKLIVIGCAHVLGLDDKWRKYIELSEELGSFCGAPYAKRTDENIAEITRRFSNMPTHENDNRR